MSPHLKSLKPKTSKDVEIIKLRTRAMISVLMGRTGCINVNQFGAWINRKSERLGWRDTQHSKKWYKLIDGEFTHPPVKSVHMLGQLFRDAEHIYYDGPSNLWRALWGNASDPAVLWPLCRTRFDSEGAWFNEIIWEEIEANCNEERTFRDTIREFEEELLIARAYGEILTLAHLTEAIALYRLHQATNSLARSDVDGVGAYRCIQHCLNDPGIFLELVSYDGFDLVRNELIEIEIGRLTAERSYRESIGLHIDQVDWYIDDPLSWIDDDTRWKSLRQERVSAAPVRVPTATQILATEILESARLRPRASTIHATTLRPGNYLQASKVRRDVAHDRVVHMHSWVKNNV